MPALIRRITLAAATLTPVELPAAQSFFQVSIGNGTAADLYVYAGDSDGEEADKYLLIPAGFERLVRFVRWENHPTVIQLKSTPGGTVVLIWG